MKITENDTRLFERHLLMQERSRATIQKYLHDVRVLVEFARGELDDKADMIRFKESLIQKGYAVSSINSMLAAVNRFLEFMGAPDWKVKFLKVQRTSFVSKDKVMGKSEYLRMVSAANDCGNERMALLLQTICSTGIRVSELQSITVDALKKGEARIHLKGKIRQILLSGELCRKLLDYCRRKRIRRGPVFITRNGKPMDRSNIWKMMKQLAKRAKVKAQKVFPHNLRHLFATTYYKKFKDVVRLADILGHSSVNTTRIYTMKDGSEQKKQISSLCLMI